MATDEQRAGLPLTPLLRSSMVSWEVLEEPPAFRSYNVMVPNRDASPSPARVELVPVERRFDADVMRRVAELRDLLWDAAAELTSPERSLVFTNFLPADRPPTVIDRHRELAQELGRPLVAVVLSCDPDEVHRRIPNADRAARMKLVDVERARTVMSTGMTLPNWPELTHLDTTGQSAAETAAQLIALADRA